MRILELDPSVRLVCLKELSEVRDLVLERSLHHCLELPRHSVLVYSRHSPL